MLDIEAQVQDLIDLGTLVIAPLAAQNIFQNLLSLQNPAGLST